MNHQIYSWKRNEYYLLSKLCKEGMIEGSLFNIEAIDFIGIIDLSEEEWYRVTIYSLCRNK